MAEIKRIRCGMVNCWIIKGEKGSVLVDTGVVRYRDMLVNAARQEDVRLVFHTHGHVDHIGNTAALIEKLSISCSMHEADVELIQKLDARELFANTFLGKIILNGTKQNKYHAPSFQPDRFFAGGETLDEFGMDAVVVALPGHTKGSLGLLVDGKNFIVGDAMFNILKPTHARIYEELEPMLDSIVAISKSGCKTVFPGHGKPFSAGEYFQSIVSG